MSDPTAVSEELDDFDRALLGSARRDMPSSGAVTRAAAALGIAAVAAPVAAAAAATSVAGRAATFSLTKWTLIGALGVAGAGTGTVAYLGSTRGVEPQSAAVPTAPAKGERHAPLAAAPAEEPASAPPQVVPLASEPVRAAPSIAGAPASPRGVAAPAAAGPAVGAPAPTTPAAPTAAPASPEAAQVTRPAPSATGGAAAVSIAEEVALVDRARHALRQGRAGEAFDTLSLYQSRWPNGVLSTEVRVLRVEAQLRLGQRASAQRDARAFIAVQPNSRYATRLRELFAPGELD